MGTKALLRKTLSQEHFYLPDYVEDAALRGLSRWDPRLKLGMLVIIIGVNVFFANFILSVILFSCSLGLALWSRIPLRSFALFFLAPAWATLIVFFGFAAGFGVTPLLSVGPVIFYKEGAYQALSLAVRVASDMGWLAITFLTTPFNQVLAALAWFRLPKILLESTALTYRYALVLLAEFHRLKDAARSRGGMRSYSNAHKSIALILTQVFLRAYDRCARIQEAMLARGAEAVPVAEDQQQPPRVAGCPNRCDITPTLATQMEIILACERLRFSYDGTPVLCDISLEVRRGEIVVLCGPNGAGKTTLLRLLTGILLPTQGEVWLGGQPLTAKNRHNAYRYVGIMSQDPHDQLFCTHVKEDIAYGPKNLGLPPEEVERLVATAMELMEVKHLASRPIHRLSYGEMKRVGLAGLIAMRPPLILLDEPTANLDPATGRQFIRLLHHLHDHHGYTFIVVTHDINLASSIATRLIILNQGRFVADGSPRQILTDQDLLAAARLEPPILTKLFRELVPELAAGGAIPLTIAEAVRLLGPLKEQVWKLSR